MSNRRGGPDDEFRCPVCHYLFPLDQRDHVQRCVRREMAQDPRIQRRIRTTAAAQHERRRAATTNTTTQQQNKPTTEKTAANGVIPPIALKGKPSGARAGAGAGAGASKQPSKA